MTQKVCYIKQKNSEILSKLRISESAGGSAVCLKATTLVASFTWLSADWISPVSPPEPLTVTEALLWVLFPAPKQQKKILSIEVFHLAFFRPYLRHQQEEVEQEHLLLLHQDEGGQGLGLKLFETLKNRVVEEFSNPCETRKRGNLKQ